MASQTNLFIRDFKQKLREEGFKDADFTAPQAPTASVVESSPVPQPSQTQEVDPFNLPGDSQDVQDLIDRSAQNEGGVGLDKLHREELAFLKDNRKKFGDLIALDPQAAPAIFLALQQGLSSAAIRKNFQNIRNGAATQEVRSARAKAQEKRTLRDIESVKVALKGKNPELLAYVQATVGVEELVRRFTGPDGKLNRIALNDAVERIRSSPQFGDRKLSADAINKKRKLILDELSRLRGLLKKSGEDPDGGEGFDPSGNQRKSMIVSFNTLQGELAELEGRPNPRAADLEAIRKGQGNGAIPDVEATVIQPNNRVDAHGNPRLKLDSREGGSVAQQNTAEEQLKRNRDEAQIISDAVASGKITAEEGFRRIKELQSKTIAPATVSDSLANDAAGVFNRFTPDIGPEHRRKRRGGDPDPELPASIVEELDKRLIDPFLGQGKAPESLVDEATEETEVIPPPPAAIPPARPTITPQAIIPGPVTHPQAAPDLMDLVKSILFESEDEAVVPESIPPIQPGSVPYPPPLSPAILPKDAPPATPRNLPADMNSSIEDHIRLLPGKPGIFGQRPDGTEKGSGFFGALKGKDGSVSSELSLGFEVDGKEVLMPAMVPTLTASELKHLLDGKEMTDAIADKAFKHGMQRIRSGKSPFIEPGESEAKAPSAKRATPEELSRLQAINKRRLDAPQSGQLTFPSSIKSDKLKAQVQSGAAIGIGSVGSNINMFQVQAIMEQETGGSEAFISGSKRNKIGNKLDGVGPLQVREGAFLDTELGQDFLAKFNADNSTELEAANALSNSKFRKAAGKFLRNPERATAAGIMYIDVLRRDVDKLNRELDLGLSDDQSWDIVYGGYNRGRTWMNNQVRAKKSFEAIMKAYAKDGVKKYVDGIKSKLPTPQG